MNITTVIETQPCKVHRVQKDQPCWWIKQDKTRKISFAICDARARAAGAVGKIDPNSLRKNFSKKGK